MYAELPPQATSAATWFHMVTQLGTVAVQLSLAWFVHRIMTGRIATLQAENNSLREQLAAAREPRPPP